MIGVVQAGPRSGYGGSKLAATVLLIRDGHHGLEVWVQERVNTMPNYPGITVFPGGGVDPRDYPPKTWDSGDLWLGPSAISVARTMGTTKDKAHALVFAAVRETFEETGTLLAVHGDGTKVSDAAPLHSDRLALESHRLSLTTVLKNNNLKVDSRLIHPFARWVGKSERGQWFDTFSFLALQPEGQHPDSDNTETDSAGWFPPRLLLDGWRNGLVRFVIPTWAQLQQLSHYQSADEALADAHNADLEPHIGDVSDDPRYGEFYSHAPVDRI
ncbi:NUDIX domain-containing protein [Corynebacterium sp. 3HC-13]|uniref:NUDIX hydrolase n=1 Tax=Corynebacterium poyangense TaxID=2684405 RepID=UPI001CCD2A0E|nr:NUDIX domain-containing protein [Corynebacterium poyangense]MBZ8177097.1 NUDIX domain-containing protein [Corynebacterium poyangense]